MKDKLKITRKRVGSPGTVPHKSVASRPISEITDDLHYLQVRLRCVVPSLRLVEEVLMTETQTSLKVEDGSGEMVDISSLGNAASDVLRPLISTVYILSNELDVLWLELSHMDEASPADPPAA